MPWCVVGQTLFTSPLLDSSRFVHGASLLGLLCVLGMCGCGASEGGPVAELPPEVSGDYATRGVQGRGGDVTRGDSLGQTVDAMPSSAEGDASGPRAQDAQGAPSPVTRSGGPALRLSPGAAGGRLTSQSHTLWLTVSPQPGALLASENHRLWLMSPTPSSSEGVE